MSSRGISQAILLLLTAAAWLSPVSLAACVRTPGAPADDYLETESASQAMQEEEEEDAWDDANR